MVKKKTLVKCKFGRLATPVRSASGSIRRCKLKPKTSLGRSMDRKTKSGENHEVRYRRDKRKAKAKTARKKKRK